MKNFSFSIRIFFKYKMYNAINWLGLSIGLASFLFINHFVQFNHQFDDFHVNKNRIYRLHTQVNAGGNTETYATTGKPVAEILSKNFVDFESYARLNFLSKPNVKIKEQIFREDGFAFANPETLEVFSFNFLMGDKNCLKNIGDIAISQSLAEKYFNSYLVLNQSLQIEDRDYVVKGVFADLPENSHLKIQALLYELPIGKYELQDWFNLDNYSYVLAKPGISAMQVNEHLEQFTENQLTEPLKGTGIEATILARPLLDLYFSEALINDTKKGNRLHIMALAIGAWLILLVAGFNFINLSLTQSVQRNKEFYLKKILGVDRLNFFVQAARESLLMSFFVVATTTLMIILFMPSYLQLSGIGTFHLMQNLPIFLLLTILSFLFILFSNGYPLLVMSFKNLQLAKVNKAGAAFKGTLLVIQFMITAITLIVTFTAQKQVSFIKNKELGFTRENIVIVDLPELQHSEEKNLMFKASVLQHSAVQNASLIGGGALPGEDNGKEIFTLDAGQEQVEKIFNLYRVDEAYFGLLNIQLAEGRLFLASSSTDKQDAVIINQALAKSMNWQNPLGKKIYYGDKAFQVIGVVRDFHNKSLHNLIEPIVFLYNTDFSSKILISTNVQENGFINSIWEKHFPESNLSLGFFDQLLQVQYKREVVLMKLLAFFSIVSLTLCLTGLFAIFSFQILLKTKEMSIRRILGAGSVQIIHSSARPFFWFIIIAIGSSFPLAYFILQNWLQDYSYRITQDPIIFAYTTFIILFLSFLIVLFHTTKIIHTNPAEVLKDE